MGLLVGAEQIQDPHFPLYINNIQLIDCVRLNLSVLGQERLAGMGKRAIPEGDGGPSKAAKLANPWAAKIYDFAKRLDSTLNFKASSRFLGELWNLIFIPIQCQNN